MTHSLWLVPPAPIHGRLAGVIADLARRHGAVAFEPHLTLLGSMDLAGEELMAATRRLAARLRPFSVSLTEVATGTGFFHCVYVAAAETSGLLQAHALAREAFGVEAGDPFRPHLSLAYGLLDAAEKEAARLAAGDLGCGFSVDEINVMDTGGDVAGWRRLARLPFGS